jgi:hypothetical protein
MATTGTTPTYTTGDILAYEDRANPRATYQVATSSDLPHGQYRLVPLDVQRPAPGRLDPRAALRRLGGSPGRPAVSLRLAATAAALAVLVVAVAAAILPYVLHSITLPLPR